MKIRKATWLFMLVAVLLVTLCTGFIFQKQGKDTGCEEAIAKQDGKIAELEERIAEQNRKLIEQDKKLVEIEHIRKKVEEIQVDLSTRKSDINDVDMSLIQEMIERQVRLNVKKEGLPKIGIISIRKIFRDCNRSAKYREEAIAAQHQADMEVNKLEAEIEAQKAGLKTLTIGSSDYLTQMRQILEKQASLQVQQEFHRQQRTLKEQKMTEEIYKDILRITGQVAKEKALELVFEKSEPKFPALGPTELELSMGMHKLLYSQGCIDITNDVMTRLDSESSS